MIAVLKRNLETGWPLCALSCVCVFGVLTQGLCYPPASLSPHLPPVAADKGIPVAATSTATHTHTHTYTHTHTHTHTQRQCVLMDSGVAVLAASSQRGPLCFTSGLDSRQTIWEQLTGSLDEVIEWGVHSCAVYFLYFFFLLLLLRGALLLSVPALSGTNQCHCLCERFSVVCVASLSAAEWVISIF